MVKLNIRQLPIFLIFSLFPLAASAQQWTQYTVADGLPPGRIFAIYEDREDNLWFGTSNGACRFDGFRFHTFTEPKELSEASVADILQDHKGDFWFATSNGFWRYDGQTFNVYTSKDGLADDFYSILEDRRGNLWIGTNPSRQTSSNGVSRYDGSRFETFNIENGLVTNRVIRLFSDREGNVWITGYGGISRYDGNSFQNFPTPSTNGIDEAPTSVPVRGRCGICINLRAQTPVGRSLRARSRWIIGI